MFSGIIKFINVSERNTPGTLSYLHYNSKEMSLTSVINSMIDKTLDAIPEGGKPEVDVNRRKAFLFGEEGKIDHEGKHSIFG